MKDMFLCFYVLMCFMLCVFRVSAGHIYVVSVLIVSCAVDVVSHVFYALISFIQFSMFCESNMSK